MFELDGKVAIVTGALGLLGRQHCHALASAGANVAVTDLDPEAVAELASEIAKEHDGKAVGVACDITDPASVEALLAVVLEEWDRIDVLVNNAAINDMVETAQDADPTERVEKSKFENYPLELWRKVLDVNVTGSYLTCQIIGAEMARRGCGSIINVASTYGMVAPDQSIYLKPGGERLLFKSAAYPVTKGAVIQLTRFVASYWGAKGVRANTLSPGGVENGQEAWFVENYSQKTPIGRMAQPDDYRGAVVFLASDASAYMNGANLVVDGGWTAW